MIQSGVSLPGMFGWLRSKSESTKGDGFASTLMICADFTQPDLDSSILTRDLNCDPETNAVYDA